MTMRLIMAAANNQTGLVGQYLRAGDDVNYQESMYGQTALHCALKSKHYELANFLYHHYGANANIKDFRGFTAYDVANGKYEKAMDAIFTDNAMGDYCANLNGDVSQTEYCESDL